MQPMPMQVQTLKLMQMQMLTHPEAKANRLFQKNTNITEKVTYTEQLPVYVTFFIRLNSAG